jgi:hypothetical protein
MAAAEASAPKTGVVRDTLQYATGLAWGIYGQAEKFTVVQYTLNLTKPLIPIVQPAVKRAVEFADPWVDTVDSYATPAWKNVNTRVVEPATLTLKKSYTTVLDLSDKAVDTILPETEKDPSKIEKKEQEKSLVEIRSKTQKRITKRLEKGWKDIRAFSAGTLKGIIRIDIIEFAESKYALTVSLTQKHVVPVYNDLTTRGSAIATSTKTVYDENSKFVWAQVAKYQEITYQRYNAAYKFASDKAEEFGVPALLERPRKSHWERSLTSYWSS